jgi:hypothetical protein
MTCFFALIVWYNVYFLPKNPPSVYLQPESSNSNTSSTDSSSVGGTVTVKNAVSTT